MASYKLYVNSKGIISGSDVAEFTDGDVGITGLDEKANWGGDTYWANNNIEFNTGVSWASVLSSYSRTCRSIGVVNGSGDKEAWFFTYNGSEIYKVVNDAVSVSTVFFDGDYYLHTIYDIDGKNYNRIAVTGEFNHIWDGTQWINAGLNSSYYQNVAVLENNDVFRLELTNCSNFYKWDSGTSWTAKNGPTTGSHTAEAIIRASDTTVWFLDYGANIRTFNDTSNAWSTVITTSTVPTLNSDCSFIDAAGTDSDFYISAFDWNAETCFFYRWNGSSLSLDSSLSSLLETYCVQQIVYIDSTTVFLYLQSITAGTVRVYRGSFGSWTLVCQGLSTNNSTIEESQRSAGLAVFDLRITVPDVVGETLASATSLIEAEGLTVNNVTYSYGGVSGSVLSQNPAASTKVDNEDLDVDLVISLGQSLLSVPNVSGLNLTTASSLIVDEGFELGTTTYEYRETLVSGYLLTATIASGIVISQDPGAGILTASGEQIDLVVSRGTSGILSFLPPGSRIATTYSPAKKRKYYIEEEGS